MKRVLAAGAVVATAMHAAPSALFVPAVRGVLAPRLAGHGNPGHVALTFDDGPHPVATPRFLAVLAAHRVRATFFVLGRELVRAPWLGRAIVEQGHEIAVHGWDHRCLLWRSPSAVFDGFARTMDAIHDITGVRPRWVRAPYGVFTAASLLAARRLDLAPVLWTCWGFDWTRRATPATVTATVRRDLRGGGTILLHDSDVEATPGSWRSALGALPILLAHCHERGLTVGRLAEHGLLPAGRA
ncbi:polysaccharide deacetylase family protein [Amycolatopsis taiwanensis]|uniref:polysaccharide deacetylase family protein n=1 Tax=Amycolatopsis taiwanensis TaxID=342230 RepID=UPI000484C451|nr:polysaccharide deacetylase family protein [Amycolatopsis taiwanensis]